jgi:transcriptional regulator with XRE-family HTH domain
MEAKMKTLNPKALKQLRKKRGWSHAELERRAKIRKRRLIELEKETAESHEMRDGNFADLCRALSATPAQLRGEEPITDPMPANYVTLRSKITTVAQMNYDLISAQYGVESDQIVQLAPLMFAILVEDSFKWRREQLALRKQVLELQEKLRETVYAEHVSGPYSISPSDILHHEEEAIDRREVFTAPLEATSALLRYDEVFGDSGFESFEELSAQRITDRFTDFMAEKLSSNPQAFKADIPDIALFSVRNVLDHELRYIAVPDLFEQLTAGGDEQTTALYRLALLTGAVRLQDADPEKVTGPIELQAWFAEQLRNPDTVSRLEEVAPAVSRRELRGPDEANVRGLDEHGFPVIIEQGKKRGFPEALAGLVFVDEGDENASS